MKPDNNFNFLFYSNKKGIYMFLLLLIIVLSLSNGIAAKALKIKIDSGNNQKASASSELQDPIQVLVTDKQKHPVANQPVFFRLVDPKSRVKAFPEPRVVKTDSSGKASTQVKLGFAPGEGYLVASLDAENNRRSVQFKFTIDSVHYFGGWLQMFLILGVGIASIAFAYILAKWVLNKDVGTAAMREISDPIKQGAQGFFRTQYVTIAILALPVALILFILYILRTSAMYGPDISQFTNAFLVSFSFLIGAACSGVAGLIGMWIAVRSNIRVASAARRSYAEAVMVAIRSGAIAGFLVVALSIIGIIFLFMMLFGFISDTNISPHQIPVLLVGYGFGASFVALFAQLGGGIYTKAADVGADIIGKVEANIPEDDVRNPAVIADLVGDNVGDCAGRGADLFESIAAENIGAMILAGALAAGAAPQIVNPISYILFPLMVNIVGLIASWIGTFCVRTLDRNDNLYRNILRSYEAGDLLQMRNNPMSAASSERTSRRLSSRPLLSESQNDEIDDEDNNEPLTQEYDENENTPNSSERDLESQSMEDHLEDPMIALNRGFAVTAIIALIGFSFCCLFMLRDSRFPGAWFNFLLCGIIGVATSWVFVFITIYYTDYKWYPVRRIAEASATGAGTNVIAGISVGLESTALPVLVISIAIILAYWIGKGSGIVDIDGKSIGGLFGTAVATLGMLSTSGFILAMDTFGPIADNAGGIVEMSQLPESVRNITDRLDAVGNTTKALTKGYAIGSAALAAFLLFSAFLDEVTEVTGMVFQVVDLAVPEVFVGALLGAGLVFLFSSLAIRAVGKSAETVIMEVRRQFEEHPGIMEYEEKPDYQRCVSIVTKSSLRQMVVPGLLAVIVPIAVGFIFKFIGYLSNNALLGAQASAGFLMVATIAGILMALFLNNGGGAWDNAKKYVETGKFGGKGSEAHKAAVIGDTVGDPFKDTAGPSIHVLIKLLATITLVIGPMYVISA